MTGTPSTLMEQLPSTKGDRFLQMHRCRNGEADLLTQVPCSPTMRTFGLHTISKNI